MHPSLETKRCIRWVSASCKGNRNVQNEDSLTVFRCDRGEAELLEANGAEAIDSYDIVLGISDGMGGGKAGEIASALILEKLSEAIPSTFRAAAAGFFPDRLSHLEEAIRKVHEQVNALGEIDPSTKGMAATLALVWFAPENLYLGNVGDSRVYRQCRGKVAQISRDHSSVWAQLNRGEIQEFEYRNHPRRSALYQIIGGGHQEISPNLSVETYEEGDRYLICSDGIVDGLWERNICDFLKDPRGIDEICKSMMARVNENAAEDDATMILLEIA